MLRPFRGPDRRYRFRMALDRAGFRQALAGAVGHEPHQWTEAADGTLTATGGAGPRPWRIRARALAPLRLGALVLPRLEVELDLADQSEEDADAFAMRFLSHVQRCGG